MTLDELKFVKAQGEQIAEQTRTIKALESVIMRQEETIAELKAQAGKPGAEKTKAPRLFPFFRGFCQQPQQQPPAQ